MNAHLDRPREPGTFRDGTTAPRDTTVQGSIRLALAGGVRPCSWRARLLAGLCLVTAMSPAGCELMEEDPLTREERRAAEEETVRAFRQRDDAEYFVKWQPEHTWDLFLRELRSAPLSGGTAVVAFPLLEKEPTPEEQDQVVAALRDRGFDRVILHQILSDQVIILRE